MMDYNILLDLACDLGYELAMSGAETFRVEDSITRVLASYGLKSEVYAIPNHLIVSIITETGKPITRMRRIGYHGNDLDGVEKYNALSRAICNRHPEPTEAMDWLEMVRKAIGTYKLPVYLLGDFLGAAGFAALFGCNGRHLLLSGFCAVLGGLINTFMDRMKVNPFFSTLSSAFVMAFAAYLMNLCGLAPYVDGVIIGALMILVPGLAFVNAMRDVIYGDLNSGVIRVTQVLMVAAAIALGTAVAFNAAARLWAAPLSTGGVSLSLPLTCLGAAVGCVGFSILFNIHGPGGLICALGGVLTWAIYVLTARQSGEIMGYFWGSVFASIYAEIMARIRKYPAISYLVVSLFPLIPGAGIYYSMNHAVQGETGLFASQGMNTAAIAGVMAVGILLVSTLVRLYYTWKNMHSAGKA